MNKRSLSISNLVLSILLIWFVVMPGRLTESLEFGGYDAMMAFLDTTETANVIVLINIDDQSVESIGPWPWPRARLVEGVQKASAGGARIIGLPLVMDTPQDSFTREAIEGLAEAFRVTFGGVEDPKVKAFYQTLRDVQEQMTPDRLLADAIAAAGTVVMPVRFATGPGKSEPSAESVDLFLKNASRMFSAIDGRDFPGGDYVLFPLPGYLQSATRLGHMNYKSDSDGKLRRSSPALWYKGVPVASLPLTIASKYLNIKDNEVILQPGHSLNFNRHQIPLGPDNDFFIRFYKGRGAFDRYSYNSLISAELPKDAFRNKIVLFNFSATGLTPRITTPGNPQMPEGELCAHILRTLLDGSTVSVFPYQRWLSLSLILLVGCFITFLMPRLSLPQNAVISSMMMVLFMLGSIYLFKVERVWIHTVTPAAALPAGFFLVLLERFFFVKTRAVCRQTAFQESRRLQGMSLQSQGLLDEAWEVLKDLPMDHDLMGVCYDLAIDFEKKGEHAKALAVLERIEDMDAEFKDIQTRMKQLSASGETIITGENGGKETATGDAQTKNPPNHLGRYKLVRTLGQGAMGTVFLGLDPHIKRKTAIKTYRFDVEYDPADAEEMKRKFFREAESAGKLSHPGIVTIYDAGEESGLAFIAMEYLEGKDLRAYVAPESLLPPRKVIDYVATIAEALAYAHQKGVVHRDVKPANIMLLTSGLVKITDFGIARIIASSKTRTGVVKGTPYYMAPELITGRKADGRCDIFSLGVVLFQMLTGSLPFTATNPGALMGKIVHEPHPDPKSINPKILSPLVDVIDKALEKDVSKRYQDAWQMAAHLRIIGQKIDALMAQRKASIKANGN